MKDKSGSPSVDDCNFNTRMRSYKVEGTLKLAKRFKEDPDKKHRLASCKCLVCYYSETLAGQGFTQYTCRVCNKEELHHNTNTPELCLKCAQEKNLCRDCCAYLDGKQR